MTALEEVSPDLVAEEFAQAVQAWEEVFHSEFAQEEIDRRTSRMMEATRAYRVQAEAELEASRYRVPTYPPITGMFADIVLGENRVVFQQVEGVVNVLRGSGKSVHMGLYGPPSAGKTMTAGKIAKALERPYFEGSGGSFQGNPLDALLKIVQHIHGEDPVSEVRVHDSGSSYVHRIKPCVIFFDEAHEIPKAAEMMLLPLMEKPHTSFHEGNYYDFQDVILILGTTDSAALGRAFRSRVQEFLFVGYSEASIGEMVCKLHPQLSHAEGCLFARAGKLVPRKAINLARAVVDQITPDKSVSTILRENYEFDEHGLDRSDRKLLDILKSLTTTLSPLKLASARELIRMAEDGIKISPVSLANARALLAQPPSSRPIGIKSLADKLLMSELREVEERVNYLETLNLVRRTSRGIQIEDQR